MIFKKVQDLKKKRFENIIIGSGPAGISLALSLEKEGVESLIIEAGNIDPYDGSNNLLDGKIINENYTSLENARARQFGGSSNLWGGNCSIFSNHEIEKWGIEPLELYKFTNDAKKILNISNDFYINQITNNLNHYKVIWSNVRFAEKYYSHINKSKKINLILDTTFKYFEGNSKNIDYLVCQNKEVFKLSARNYILACGGLENNRLMLHAREKNSKIFQNDLPIGFYYFDHPKKNIGKGIINKKKLLKFLETKDSKIFPRIDCENLNFSLNSKYLETNNCLNSGLILKLKRNSPNLKIFKQAVCVAPDFIKKIYSDIKDKEIYEFDLSIIQEQTASQLNNIKLSKRETDIFGIPRIELNWGLDENFNISRTKIIEEFSSFLIDHEIGRVAIQEDYYNNENLTVGYHQMGGTRIGKNYSDSVIDKNLLVHGTNNLYICGSSTFRTAGISFPTFTVVLLSCRLGKHLILKNKV